MDTETPAIGRANLAGATGDATHAAVNEAVRPERRRTARMSELSSYPSS